MFSKKKISVLSLLILLTLMASLVFPMAAFADDIAPTPPPEVPAVETAAPATEAAANPTDTAPTEAAATEVAADPTEAVPDNPVSTEAATDAAATDTPVEPTSTVVVQTAAPAETTADVVAALSDAGAVLLDNDGSQVPLVSQRAADALSATDPWFDAGSGVIVGYSSTGSCAAVVTECHTSATPIQAAINDGRSDAKTIFVEQGFYNENVTLAKQVVLTGLGTGATVNSFTLNSGANATGSSNIFAPVVNVNNGAKVQNGVDLAANGGTVNVGAGNYVEQVVIEGKDLTLQASGAGAVIQAPDTVPLCFTTSSNQKPVVCVKNATNVIIKGLTVDGRGKGDANNRLDGIGYYNAGGTVQGNTIEHIRNTPLNGVQAGVALYAYNQDGNARTLNVFSNTIFDYQKNGMALSGNGLSVDVENNTVTGAGPTSLTAQNGIQLSYGAVGKISGNTVSGNFWTGTYGGSNDPISDPNADGAAGILIYQPGTGTIEVSNNEVLGNQFGIASFDTKSLDLHDNTIQGIAHTGNGYPAGIVLSGSAGFNSTGTIQNNTITLNDYGVLAFNTPEVGIHNNSITGNTIYGIWSDARIDATYNWWGSATGPNDNSPVPDVCGVSLTNPGGTGDAASTCVLYDPWLTADPFAGGPAVPPTGGPGSGRGQTGTSSNTSVIPVTGGLPTAISCDTPSLTLKMEEIEVTLTGLCGYDVILEQVSKENLPGDLGQGDNLEDGLVIKIMKGGQVIDTLPIEASLLVGYPKPISGETSVMTWSGNGWQEQVSYIDGNNIMTELPAPATLILVTH